MVKIFATILVSFVSFFCLSQNTSYNYYWDSIIPVVEKDYPAGRKKFTEYKNIFECDPNVELHFLCYTLKNEDVEYFKMSVTNLILDFGYKFNRTDTLRYEENEFNDLVCDKKLHYWLIERCDQLYPEWIKHNPEKFDINQKLEKLRVVDQTRGYFYQLYDSCSMSEDALKSMDYQNFVELLMICKQNHNRVPNYYDLGFNSEWHLILLHNLRKENMLEIWNMILPYIERTYFEHKIGDGYFRLFDDLMNRELGYQYYGFLENVPVFDNENLNKRKLKYSFI